MKSVIVGTGRYLPEKILTNFDLEKMVDTSDQWIQERTGIKERRIADKDTSASDLAIRAGREALKASGMEASEIDLIIVGTSTPDMNFPSTACFVQAGLGANNAAAFDILAACTGFIYALTTADSFIASGRFKNALVIGAEVYSSIIDWEDRATCVIFGDGAGAVVLKASEGESGILSANIFSDGSKADYLYTPGGGSKNRFTQELIDSKEYCLKMQGSKTFKVAVRSMVNAAKKALEKNGITKEDIKLVIPHQANQRIITAVAKHLSIDEGSCFSNIQKYGNTAAASIPIALDEVVRDGKVGKGDLILLVAFGGGFTWGSALIRL